jgi:hypothetical protein
VALNPPRLLLITSEWPQRGSRIPPQPRPASPVKRQAEALEAAGMSVEIFAFRGRNVFNYAAAWTRLRPRLHPACYDLVHAEETADVLLALPKRVPLVVTVQQRSSRWFLHRMLALVLARRADAVIVPSAAVGRQLRTRKPIFVIAPEADEQVLTARLLAVYRSVLPSLS